MATTKDDRKTGTGKSQLPPDEVFWKRHSPHHECLFSSVSSLTLHGLAIGLMILIGLAITWRRHSEQLRPPSIDVVQLEGAGDGLEEGAGSTPGGPIGLPSGSKTEAGDNATSPPDKEPAPPQTKLADPAANQLDVPMVSEIGSNDVPPESAFEALQKLKEDADAAVKTALKIPKAAVAVGTPTGTGSKVGQGGQGGTGGGPGRGNKGTGPGMGGAGGRKATRQEILANRWRFDLSGTPREHADKIDVVGFVLAIPSPRGDFLVVRDLKRRPAEARSENLAPFKDAVKWFNTTQLSIQGLARELQLPFEPRFFVLFLPKDREEKMAEAEHRYAKQHGRSVSTVRATWFDFRLQNGSFEPVVLRQE